MNRRLRRLTFTTARITDRTRWLFVQIERADGRVGTGEATLHGCEPEIGSAVTRIAPLLWTMSGDDPTAFAAAAAPQSLTEGAGVSAIDTALWDLRAQDAQSRLVDALGGAQREWVPLYANINRRTRDRSPAGFAQSARDAISAGFDALKIAPFDEVSTTLCEHGEGVQAMVAGLARIAAVRAVAGTNRRLMVDCHWRFDEPAAARMIDASAEHGLHWVECPLPEVAANIPALARLRQRAQAHGMRLAGMEQGVGYEAFRPFCEAGCYDVMMPDVKYVGGLREMLRCGEAFARHGVEMSPHNPTGPIAHVASLHLSAAMRSFDMLELQYDESALFDGLVVDPAPASSDGASALTVRSDSASALPARSNGASTLPATPGLGVHLRPDVLASCAEGEPLILEAA